MKYDSTAHTLAFTSEEELRQFHLQLSALIRSAMVQATGTIEDPEQAKGVSRDVLHDFAIVVRALNTLRRGLPRKTF
jgi:hypothetical protein